MTDIPSSADLNYFLEIANLLNISRAAERLGISQPSLTLAIRRIEKMVGTKLFLRHKHGVSLTIAGKQLYVYANQMLQEWNNIKSKTLASVNHIQGIYTLGCHASVGLYTLPLFLPSLLQEYPMLEIKLHHDHSRKIAEQIINFKIDIGIVVNPVRHGDLIIKKLFDDKIMLWRASQNKKHIDDILLCDPDLLQTQSILKILQKKNINFSRILPTNNLEVIAELTKNSCGTGILPSSVAKQKNLVAIHKTIYYADEICLIYRGENFNVKAIQVIANAIKASFKNQT